MSDRREYRIAHLHDEVGLRMLMGRLPLTLAGFRHHRLARAVCHDACRRRDCFAVLALHDGEPAGYSFVVTDWARFRVWLLVRHPPLAAGIAFSTIATGLRRRRVAPAPKPVRPTTVSTERVDGPRWSDTGPGVAKVVYTAVLPEHRRLGLASGLKRVYTQHARDLGLIRLDARISRANTASIELNRRSGWEIYPDGDHVLAVYRIT